MSVFSGRAPMCRAGPSAHGRISTALSAGEFSHDSADPSLVGPDRMCNTAPRRLAAPIPRTRARRPDLDTTDPHPPSRTIASLSAHPGIPPARKALMTPFPGSAGAVAHPKVTRRPPLSALSTPPDCSRTATAGPQARRSSPRGPSDAAQTATTGIAGGPAAPGRHRPGPERGGGKISARRRGPRPRPPRPPWTGPTAGRRRPSCR